MQSFHFLSPLLHDALLCRQQVTASIGWKLYPGSLLMCQAIEQAAAGAGEGGGAHRNAGTDILAAAIQACTRGEGHVLEVGAGVTGLPSLLLSAAGVPCVVTDVAPILPLLEENLRAAGATGSRCRAAALTWGTDAEADACAPRTQLIIGADVVYHTHLIEPLLSALLRLTEKAENRNTPILLSYVQRFKRAKTFFKRAQKWFHVTSVPLGDVVDYDTLSWSRDGGSSATAPAVASPTPRVTSTSANHEAYCATLLAAATEQARAAAAAAAAAPPPASLPAADPETSWRRRRKQHRHRSSSKHSHRDGSS
ncbi:hypothetical protein EON68_01925, partial [archaeon]